MALTSAQKFLTNAAGLFVEQIAAIVGGVANAFKVVALNAQGQLDITMMPTGVGPDTAVMTSTDALAAGAWVNVYNNAGTENARNADASVTGKPCNGFVLAAVAQGGQATVYFSGVNTAVTGQTPGPVFLSDTNVGQGIATAPTTSGHIVQNLGDAVSATAVNFARMPTIQLA